MLTALSEGVYHPDGALQTEKLTQLSRPYAPVVAGVPTGWGYEERRRVFTLRYTIGGTEAEAVKVEAGTVEVGERVESDDAVESSDAAVGDSQENSSSRTSAGSGSTGATLIFKHQQLHYPDGVSVSITPPHAASWAEQGDDYLLITHNQTAVECATANGEAIELEVVVRPRS